MEQATMMARNQPDGHLALPPAGKGDAVLVLHAWWGLNETIKALCGRLAEAGFVAFAPDLYHGKLTDTIDHAQTLAEGVFGNLDQARADVAEAAAFLREHAAATPGGLAVIGFSLGAFFALDLSVVAPEQVRSVVVFYGTRPGDYSAAKAAYLGHFAEVDAFEPQAEVDGLEAALERAGCPVTFYSYSGTGHWFFEPDRADAYNEAAANLAWERTLAFLKRSETA
jgi:carboxymethylenebutenolidase